MSYANFGPDYRVQSVGNLAAGLEFPVTALDAALASLNLLQIAGGGAEIPLVLAEGTYVIEAVALLNPANAAGTIQYMQCQVVGTAGGLYGVSTAIFGADILGATNVTIPFIVSAVVVVPPAGLSLAYRCTGNGVPAVQPFINGQTFLRATKISA